MHVADETKDVFTFEELETNDANCTKFDKVHAYGEEKKTVRIGSLNSEDMLEWFEDNEEPAKRKEAGLRLIVKSVVNAKDERIPKENRERFLEIFRKKDAVSNGKLVKAILVLNGMHKKASEVEKNLKNDSSEVATVASPTDSPSQPAA